MIKKNDLEIKEIEDFINFLIGIFFFFLQWRIIYIFLKINCNIRFN